MPAFKRDSASRLRDAERCMKGGEPLTMREASFISSLMGHAQHIDAATVRFTMHIDGSLDGQINLAALAKRGPRRSAQAPGGGRSERSEAEDAVERVGSSLPSSGAPRKPAAGDPIESS